MEKWFKNKYPLVALGKILGKVPNLIYLWKHEENYCKTHTFHQQHAALNQTCHLPVLENLR